MNATASGVPLPARLQKASLDDSRLLLEVFTGARRFLVLRAGTLALVEERPPGEAGRPPPANQGLVRKELVPSTLVALREGPTLELEFVRPDDKRRRLVLERSAEDPRLLVLAETDDGLRVLAVLLGAPRARDGRDLRRGQLYSAPTHSGPLAVAAPATPSAARDPLAELRARLRAEHKRAKRLVDALQQDLSRHGNPQQHEHAGELLKTVLGSLKRGATSVEVTDFDGAARTIVLDPKKDGRENMTALFARAKRARTAIARTEPRLRGARAQLAALDAVRAGLGTSPTEEQVRAAQAQVTASHAASSPRRRAAKAGARKPWRTFLASGDVAVRVGRGAKDNDALVRDARGHDLWLHARDKQGAHVVVPSRGDEVPEELVLDAAHLAAHFSSARGEPRVDVQLTRVKHLKKPGPGGPAGLVYVTEEKVLPLRVDPQRLALLLGREVPS